MRTAIKTTLLGIVFGTCIGYLLVTGPVVAQVQRGSMTESIQLGVEPLRRALEESIRTNKELARSNARLADAVRELNRSMRRR